MSELKVEKHNWQPAWPDETIITDQRKNESFTITLKQGEDIQIEFEWDYGHGGRGSSSTDIPVNLLKELLEDLGM